MNTRLYKIGELSRRSGFSIQTLRFYEKESLISPRGRTESGYRLYNQDTFNELMFIQHLKQLGFSLAEIRDLKTMCACPSVKKADIKEKAKVKLKELNQKLEMINMIKTRLEKAIQLCPGDQRGISDCPIVKSDSLDIEFNI